MTPDQLDLIMEAIDTLKHGTEDTLEDLTNAIEHARESLEQVLYIQEDEG